MLGVIHANQTSMWLDPHLNEGWCWCRETGLSSPVKYFTESSMAELLLWIICVFCVMCFSCFCVCSLLPCNHLLGKGLTFWLLLVMFIVFLLLSNVVSWVRCGTGLYRFLIFAVFLTINKYYSLATLATLINFRENIWNPSAFCKEFLHGLCFYRQYEDSLHSFMQMFRLPSSQFTWKMIKISLDRFYVNLLF